MDNWGLDESPTNYVCAFVMRNTARVLRDTRVETGSASHVLAGYVICHVCLNPYTLYQQRNINAIYNSPSPSYVTLYGIYNNLVRFERSSIHLPLESPFMTQHFRRSLHLCPKYPESKITRVSLRILRITRTYDRSRSRLIFR